MSQEIVKSDLPPLAVPFLQAQERLQGREPPAPDQISKRAGLLLQKSFGASDADPYQAFAHGSLGLLAGHTQYFDGFAVLMGLAQGVAVALRPAEDDISRLVFEGEDQEWSWTAGTEAADWPTWSCLVRRLVEHGAPTGVEVAVVSTVPPTCIDAYLAALGMACEDALRSMRKALASERDGITDEEATVDAVHEAVMSCEGFTTSIAYPLAVYAADAPNFTLVDTKTREHLPLKAKSRDEVAWGLVTLQQPNLRDTGFHSERSALARRALTALQAGEFAHINSLRELEHRDLQRALSSLPANLKPIVRHLVTENRRVHRLVYAVRHDDWQMFGTLLMMSHASLRADWDGTTEATDLVVDVVQAMTLEGMYGACITGRGSSVLIVGRPYSVPHCLDRISATLTERLDLEPVTTLL